MELSEEIMEQVRRMVRERMPVCAVGPDSILGECGVDSYQIMEIVVEAEQHFQITLEPEALTDENLKSIRSISKLIASALAGER